MKQHYLIITLALLSTCFILIAGCGSEDNIEPPPPEPAKITVGKVEIQNLTRKIEAPAAIQAKHRAALSFLQGGYVESADYQMGDEVHKGDTLATLDNRALQAEFDRAQAACFKAKRDCDRAKSLHQSGSLPMEKFNDAQTGLALAEAALNAAQFALDHGIITAPFDGSVTERFIEAGQIVPPGAPVYQLVNADTLQMTVGVPERYIAAIRIGDPAEIALLTQPERIIPGEVTALPSSGDFYKGIMPVEVECVNSPGWLPGMAVKVKIFAGEPEAILTIPPEAVKITSDGEASCYRFRPHKGDVIKTTIYLGKPVEDKLEILSGIEKGALVVCGGIDRVRDGDLVTVVNFHKGDD
ncbi:MAG: efflux RND transporter periplasmic adaptor subunit [candidate division Zixibacteria bacterium]|nr:efflux RND transporter periplasmic adaptor subunit [Candidatus Tariuqbacter arcticus]